MEESLLPLIFFGAYAAFFYIVIVVFIAPTHIAFKHNHPNRWPIAALNFLLGGTGIGWGIALIWALRWFHLPGDGSSHTGGDSGLNIFANDVQPVRVEPSMNSPAPQSIAHVNSDDESLQQLERLQRLRQEGHITQEEHSKLKAAIFGMPQSD